MQLQDLNWDNYLSLNDEVKKEKYKIEYLSPVVIMQYQFYGFHFKFTKHDQFVIIYVKYDNKNKFNGQWVVYASYYQPNFNLNELKDTIKNDLFILNKSDYLNFVDLLDTTIIDWQLENYDAKEAPYISNYIYELDKMKTFSGKKLQKKRNHLNAFLKENYALEIKNYRELDINKIIDFCDYHIKKYSETYRAYELNVYKQYLLHEALKDQRYFGTVILINNQIVAFTFGFINHDTFEVIIEKAERDIRGLYQFLIVKNLELHNVNVKYMDREDDDGLNELAHSKKSYNPILMVKRYSITDIKGWFNN